MVFLHSNVSYTFSYDETLIGIESNPSGDTDYGKGYKVSATEFGESVPVTITSSDENVTPIEVDVNTGYKVNIYDSSGSNVVAIYSVKSGASLSLPNLSTGGYGITKAQSSASYINGQSITVNSNMALYCLEPYTVKIYNGSSLANSYSVARGRTLTLPYYSSNGYSTSMYATSSSYSNGQTITVDSDLSLYCLTLYTLTIYKYDSLYTSYTVNSNSPSITLPSVTPDSGETFYGYTLTRGNTSIDYTGGQTITVSGDTNLYGVFEYTSTTQINKLIYNGTGPVTINSYYSLGGNGNMMSFSICVDTYKCGNCGKSVRLHTDGTTPYATLNGNYIQGYDSYCTSGTINSVLAISGGYDITSFPSTIILNKGNDSHDITIRITQKDYQKNTLYRSSK